MTDKIFEAQLCNPVTEDDAMTYIDSSDFWASEKKNGRRLICFVRGPGGIVGFNRNGEIVSKPIPPQARTSLRFLASDKDLLVDGELVEDTYFLFDVIAAPGISPSTPLNERWNFLEKLWEGVTSEIELFGLSLLPVAKTWKEKANLVRNTYEQGGEGVVFKKKDSPYRKGRPSRLGDWIKWQFRKTCDCVVIEVGPKDDKDHHVKDSLVVGLWNGDEFKEVAAVKCAPEVRLTTDIGQVVEVRYLNLSKDQKLVQPVLLHLRYDKSPIECSMSQVDTYKETKTIGIEDGSK